MEENKEWDGALKAEEAGRILELESEEDGGREEGGRRNPTQSREQSKSQVLAQDCRWMRIPPNRPLPFQSSRINLRPAFFIFIGVSILATVRGPRRLLPETPVPKRVPPPSINKVCTGDYSVQWQISSQPSRLSHPTNMFEQSLVFTSRNIPHHSLVLFLFLLCFAPLYTWLQSYHQAAPYLAAGLTGTLTLLLHLFPRSSLIH